MINEITVDDLEAPEISDRGLEILAERAAIPIEFSIQGILQFAEDASDVPIHQDEDFFQNLERFLLEGDRRGGFSEAGKKLLAAECANLIIQRSRLEALFRQHPEIADVEVTAPIVIAGIPRSGTTNLSNIMSSDSRLRALSFWQSRAPFPANDPNQSPELSEEERAELGRQVMADMHALMPLSKLMYDISFADAMEELCFMAMAGCPLMYMPQTYTPDWNHWFYNEMDPAGMYNLIKRGLQALNWLQRAEKGAAKRWVLKTPHHLGFLPALHGEFPDAHLIVTHRDPASSTVSNATMNAYVLRETHARPDPQHGYEVAVHMADGMIGGLVRDIDTINWTSVTHVHFHNYMADVMGTLESIYDAVNLPFTDQARVELKAYIDAHPRGRHGGKLTYNPERDFGVTREQIRDRYQAYIEKFSVRIEEHHA